MAGNYYDLNNDAYMSQQDYMKHVQRQQEYAMRQLGMNTQNAYGTQQAIPAPQEAKKEVPQSNKALLLLEGE